ncbi:MAG: glucose-6-phosphate dehydrogenase [Chloroflexi bacterium]|nr:glucose-6-phosphate dehydrogenase [Chloroflexota bacterium]
MNSTAFVIFGVTGDLTRRKLAPALFELALAERLPQPFHLIGFARRAWDDAFLAEELRKGALEFAPSSRAADEGLGGRLANIHYLCSGFDELDGYRRLGKLLDDLEVENRIYYLAAPPEAYQAIIRSIGDAGLAKSSAGWTRIVIEKPYGQDMESARRLDAEVHKVFSEEQVYRIDHYLGKETVQNILVFRFANGIFEPLWNQRNVDHVQITVAETVGVGSRAGYYERSGVIRDMFQNHMLQLLALTAMEAPVAFTADAVRDEKVKILRSLRPLRGNDALEHTFRAQYVAGSIDGKRVPGYKDEPGVSPESTTETLLAVRLFVDSWRWAGVPFYLLSGKRLPQRLTEIAIHFKQAPLPLFGRRNLAGDAPNVLTLNLQPDEGIVLTFGAKAPGPTNQIAPVKMSFDYVQAFGSEPPEAYERLLLDCLSGDATLFTRTDEVQAAWSFTTDLIEGWRSQPVKNLPVYEAGTWGPSGVDDFMRQAGDHSRRNP